MWGMAERYSHFSQATLREAFENISKNHVPSKLPSPTSLVYRLRS
jgi:hypothetical protein